MHRNVHQHLTTNLPRVPLGGWLYPVMSECSFDGHRWRDLLTLRIMHVLPNQRFPAFIINLTLAAIDHLPLPSGSRPVGQRRLISNWPTTANRAVVRVADHHVRRPAYKTIKQAPYSDRVWESQTHQKPNPTPQPKQRTGQIL